MRRSTLGYEKAGRENQAEEKSSDQSAQMRGHADLRRRKIECDLDRDDQAAMFASRCLASGAWRCRSKNPAHAPTIPMMQPEAPMT